MLENIMRLKELNKEVIKAQNEIENYLKDRFKTIKSVHVSLNGWVSVSTDFHDMTMWSSGGIDEKHNCPSVMPNTAEEFISMSKQKQQGRQEALTALYYIKFRR